MQYFGKDKCPVCRKETLIVKDDCENSEKSMLKFRYCIESIFFFFLYYDTRKNIYLFSYKILYYKRFKKKYTNIKAKGSLETYHDVYFAEVEETWGQHSILNDLERINT